MSSTGPTSGHIARPPYAIPTHAAARATVAVIRPYCSGIGDGPSCEQPQSTAAMVDHAAIPVTAAPLAPSAWTRTIDSGTVRRRDGEQGPDVDASAVR